jgi:hypothetical protein
VLEAMRDQALMTKILLLLLLSLTLQAHQSRENFVDMQMHDRTLVFNMDIESANFEQTMPIDDSSNGIVSFTELKRHKEEILSRLFDHFSARCDGEKLAIAVHGYAPHRRQDQTYLKITSDARFSTCRNLQVRYDLFFAEDPQQKALFTFNKAETIYRFDPDHRTQTVSGQPQSLWEQFVLFFHEGVWHIWIGFDHILFVLMLLFPAVLFSKTETGSEQFPAALSQMVKVVTAFSVAHSITLFLSVSGLVELPVRFVESAIAASIVVAAWFNLTRQYRHNGVVTAFTFGLLHGFGFAAALQETLGDYSGTFAMTLLGFNLGVETGQLAIVLPLFPLLYLGRNQPWYRGLLFFVSTVTLLLALLWLIERSFAVSVLPF